MWAYAPTAPDRSQKIIGDVVTLRGNVRDVRVEKSVLRIRTLVIPAPIGLLLALALSAGAVTEDFSISSAANNLRSAILTRPSWPSPARSAQTLVMRAPIPAALQSICSGRSPSVWMAGLPSRTSWHARATTMTATPPSTDLIRRPRISMPRCQISGAESDSGSRRRPTSRSAQPANRPRRRAACADKAPQANLPGLRRPGRARAQRSIPAREYRRPARAVPRSGQRACGQPVAVGVDGL